jgi:hypothetical protein
MPAAAQEARSLRLDLAVDGDQRYQPILDSIRRYRAACRQLFAVLGLAQAATARIEEAQSSLRLQPASDAAKLALAAALGAARIDKGERVRGEGQSYQVQVGSGLGYELRDYFQQSLYPDALSFVWDSARRQVISHWTAGDAEFPQASRGWLVLQGGRGLAEFRRVGIEFSPGHRPPAAFGTWPGAQMGSLAGRRGISLRPQARHGPVVHLGQGPRQ